MTIDELRREALRLDPSTRAGMAREPLDGLESLTDAEVEQFRAKGGRSSRRGA